MRTKVRKWNLNQNVYVVLDPQGEDILRKHCKTDNIHLWKSEREGYYRFQMWQFMQIFGESLRFGWNPPFSCEVLIEE